MVRIRAGCEFVFATERAVHAVFQIRPRLDGDHTVIREVFDVSPNQSPGSTYQDIYGNTCQRLEIPPHHFRLYYDVIVDVPAAPDAVNFDAREVAAHALPDDALLYTMPSRYCMSDLLSDAAWQLFGNIEPGYGRVQAISDYVHEHIEFQYGSTSQVSTAQDVFESQRGVCRDFAHLAISFCRALNIPARYVFGYLPDINVPLDKAPMDFAAWTEVWLGDKWYTFDPRNNKARTGRIVIGRGRDALDVAMATTFGAAQLDKLVVWADEVQEPNQTSVFG